MQIAISSILQLTSPISRHSFEELVPLPDEGERLLEPVVGELTVERMSDRLLKVSGHFQTRLELRCDRCGETYESPAEFDLDEALEIVHEPITAEEVEDRVEANGNLDVTDLLRQTLLLSLPPRRLCGCEPLVSERSETSADPRWAALRSILPENGTPR
jgi:uncharacterized metal-binding protein YceD (DUF177 family)